LSAVGIIPRTMVTPPKKLMAIYAALVLTAASGWSAALVGAGPRQV